MCNVWMLHSSFQYSVFRECKVTTDTQTMEIHLKLNRICGGTDIIMDENVSHLRLFPLLHFWIFFSLPKSGIDLLYVYLNKNDDRSFSPCSRFPTKNIIIIIIIRIGCRGTADTCCVFVSSFAIVFHISFIREADAHQQQYTINKMLKR